MIPVILNAETIETREDLYAAVRRQLELPAWFGANADALYDALTSLVQPTVVTVLHPGKLRRRLGDGCAAVERALLDAAAANPALRVVFTSWDGEGC